MAFTPAHTRKYEAVLRLAAGEAMAGEPPFDEAVSVTIMVWLPIPRSFSKRRHAEAMCRKRLPITRPDIDNYGKIALDACNGIVFRDDALVTDLAVAKRYSEKPKLAIMVTPMTGVNTEGAD